MFTQFFVTVLLIMLGLFYLAKAKVKFEQFKNPSILLVSTINYYGLYCLIFGLFFAGIVSFIYILLTAFNLAKFSLPEIMKIFSFSLFLSSSYIILKLKSSINARKRFENYLKLIFFSVTSFSVLIAFIILYSLLSFAVEFFRKVPFEKFIFSTQFEPEVASGDSFGILPLLSGTLLVSFIAILVAAPLGVLSGVYLSEYSSGRKKIIIKMILDLMSGIPTVVYGYFAAVFLAPLVKSFFEALGFSVSIENALTAGLVMGVMIIPFIASLSHDFIFAVPRTLRDAGLAMGSTKEETIMKIILPAAKPCIIAAIIMAISRAIGETMIVTMAAGLQSKLTINPLESVTTITAQIVALLSGDQQFSSLQTLSAFALALSLFLITFILNVLAGNVLKSFEKKFSS